MKRFLAFTTILLLVGTLSAQSIPDPLTGRDSNVQRTIAQSRNSPDITIEITDTLCVPGVSLTEVKGLPHSNVRIEYQYGGYDENGGWNIHGYEVTYNTTIHNYQFVDSFGKPLVGYFAVWAHIWILDGPNENYYGVTKQCAHIVQLECEEPEVTVLGGCDTVYIYLPTTEVSDTPQQTCIAFVSAFPSHPYRGNDVTLRWDNPYNEEMSFQLYNVSTGVYTNFTASGTETKIPTGNLPVGSYIVYVTGSQGHCGLYDKFTICE